MSKDLVGNDGALTLVAFSIELDTKSEAMLCPHVTTFRGLRREASIEGLSVLARWGMNQDRDRREGSACASFESEIILTLDRLGPYEIVAHRGRCSFARRLE